MIPTPAPAPPPLPPPPPPKKKAWVNNVCTVVEEITGLKQHFTQVRLPTTLKCY